ncbi:hypothetical protein Tco_1095122 [Tanacetum coccineum]
MDTQASSSHGFKKIKLTIIPPKQLFVDLTSDNENLSTPSPTITSSSPTPPNAPSKPTSTKETTSSHENTSSSFQSKLQVSLPLTNEPTSPQPQNPFLQNLMDVPPRTFNPQPLQSIPSLDITLSLSPITPLENLSSPSSPSPSPPPQPPIMGHLLYYNYHDYHRSNCICCFHNCNLHLNLQDEINIMFAHLEFFLRDVNAQTRFEITSKQSNDPPLSRGYTLGSGEDSMKQLELMELCTQLSYKNRKSVLFLLLVYFNAAKLMLMLLGSVHAVRHMLMLPVQVPAAEVNEVRQLQALVDKKRVIVTESSIMRDLHLDDAEVTDCLPTVTIFEELARMGAKSTAWNEFSSTMASLIICLATNQKFNLFKYIFDPMVKHLDGGIKFLMYPRFLQVFINQKLGNMSHHKKIFVNPFHTNKVFANMKRPGKYFSRRITPLFDTMMVQPYKEVGEDSDHPNDSTQVPILDQPSTSSKPKKKQPSKKTQRQEAEVSQEETEHEESVPTPFNDQ